MEQRERDPIEICAGTGQDSAGQHKRNVLVTGEISMKRAFVLFVLLLQRRGGSDPLVKVIFYIIRKKISAGTRMKTTGVTKINTADSAINYQG